MNGYFKKKDNEDKNTRNNINNVSNVKNSRSGILFFYITLLFVFAAIFFLAYINLNKKINVFGIRGMPAEFEDWMIMILSVGSMIKIIVDMYKLK
ncbi:MAG: hypothetical protein QXL18_05315 [Candidatus Woesearchaeota archaeon]